MKRIIISILLVAIILDTKISYSMDGKDDDTSGTVRAGAGGDGSGGEIPPIAVVTDDDSGYERPEAVENVEFDDDGKDHDDDDDDDKVYKITIRAKQKQANKNFSKQRTIQGHVNTIVDSLHETLLTRAGHWIMDHARALISNEKTVEDFSQDRINQKITTALASIKDQSLHNEIMTKLQNHDQFDDTTKKRITKWKNKQAEIKQKEKERQRTAYKKRQAEQRKTEEMAQKEKKAATKAKIDQENALIKNALSLGDDASTFIEKMTPEERNQILEKISKMQATESTLSISKDSIESSTKHIETIIPAQIEKLTKQISYQEVKIQAAQKELDKKHTAIGDEPVQYKDAVRSKIDALQKEIESKSKKMVTKVTQKTTSEKTTTQDQQIPEIAEKRKLEKELKQIAIPANETEEYKDYIKRKQEYRDKLKTVQQLNQEKFSLESKLEQQKGKQEEYSLNIEKYKTSLAEQDQKLAEQKSQLEIQKQGILQRLKTTTEASI